MNHSTPHQFHIPVMGLAFTVDTPIKVAKYGIDSVLSIIDNQMLEQMREVICHNENIQYVVIDKNTEDYKAKRITAYLNLLNEIVKKQFDEINSSNFETNADFNIYFDILPTDSKLRELYLSLPSLNAAEQTEAVDYLKSQVQMGSIDVNIMTKVDKINYTKSKEPMPSEFSDALTCLRGFANSTLCSSVVFSAGINPRLYSYIESFNDFFPNEKGELKKKVIVKVSDYRSALIQGKFLAKKGVWVSEFRIESGLNCGGHAFATDGILLGPILEEFKINRNALTKELFEIANKALENNGKTPFAELPKLKITTQGGVGTAEESAFLREHYNLENIGWGSPFLLVPEATNLDSKTLKDLSCAEPSNFYLSHASPLGVPFNNFTKTSSIAQRLDRIEKGKIGSPCVKKYLQFDTEFTDLPICTASTKYQTLKLQQLKETALSEEDFLEKSKPVLEKECLCEGLAAPALIVNNVPLKMKAVSVCPGPNLAYFSGVFTLKNMVDHIYGRINLLNDLHRPNLFVNELNLYFNYLKKEIGNSIETKEVYFNKFKTNLLLGIDYYKNMSSVMGAKYSEMFATMGDELIEIEQKLEAILFEKKQEKVLLELEPIM